MAIPLRKCIGCNQMLEKRTLIRIVRNKEGQVSLDKTSKAPGRGAYLCNNIECFNKAQKSRAIERGLKQKIDIEIYEGIGKQITNE